MTSSFLRSEILQKHSKAQTMHIVHQIGDDRAAFIRCREGRLRELEQEVMRSVGIEPPPVEPSGEAEEPIADADADEPLVESGAAGPSLGQLLSTVLTNLARPR